MKPMTLLSEVKASDLMQGGLITLSADAPLGDAIRTFEENRISGAPVTDRTGKLVGVLSMSDVARTDHVRGGRIETERADYYLANPLDDEGDTYMSEVEGYSPVTGGTETIRHWMNPAIISLRRDASLKEVCEIMARERVHRVLVAEDEVVFGIISTLDVVRFLANEL